MVLNPPDVTPTYATASGRSSSQSHPWKAATGAGTWGAFYSDGERYGRVDLGGAVGCVQAPPAAGGFGDGGGDVAVKVGVGGVAEASLDDEPVEVL